MMSLFEEEIREQPAVIGRLVRDETGQIRQIVEWIQERPPRFILIAARGTSDNAATYAKYLFGMLNRMPVGLAIPSLYTHYESPPDVSDSLVIGISQSGETPDVLSVLQDARRQGVRSIAITNRADSPMAQAADHAVFLDAGLEKAVPASKTYTAQLTAIACIAAQWRQDAAHIAQLNHLADMARVALEQKPAAAAVAKRFAAKDALVVIARGINQCTASEVALKIKEMTYIASEGYSAADFRHGPIAMLDKGFPALAIAPRGRTLPDMTQMVEEIAQTGADLAVLSNDDAVLARSQWPLLLPAELEEWLSPVVATIPGQMISLQLSLEKGYDPDHPRGLKKITLTT